MSTETHQEVGDQTVPPAIVLLDLIMGSMVTQAIHVAAQLDVA